MQLHIRHETTYRYAQAAQLIVQALRMWPAPAAGQRVREWQVSVDGRRLRPTCTDGFGNPVATHTVDRAVEAVRIAVRGQVETRDLHGVQGDLADTLPPSFYLAPTPLTRASDAMAELAAACAGAGNPIERLHRLSSGVRDRVDYLPDVTDVETTAIEAFAAARGVCQDHAHVMIGMARTIGFAARYVSGYLCPIGDAAAASHAWAEVYVENLGWVGFDAANRQCPDERYVRIACGRDYRDAAPVRGVRRGGIAETLEVDVRITETAQQAQ